jgi:hypothetical protein
MAELEHTRSCPELTPGSDDFCTCGLEFRKQLSTEREMHAAWRKRAEEAEVRIADVIDASRKWRRGIPGKSTMYQIIIGLAEMCHALDKLESD